MLLRISDALNVVRCELSFKETEIGQETLRIKY